MSVFEVKKIDRIGETTDGVVHLAMYCPGVLGQDFSFEDIAEKTETYLEFILEGELQKRTPQFANKPLLIRVSCEYWPHADYKARFLKMSKQLQRYDIALLVDVSSLRAKGGIFDYAS